MVVIVTAMLSSIMRREMRKWKSSSFIDVNSRWCAAGACDHCTVCLTSFFNIHIFNLMEFPFHLDAEGRKAGEAKLLTFAQFLFAV